MLKLVCKTKSFLEFVANCAYNFLGILIVLQNNFVQNAVVETIVPLRIAPRD